MIVVLIDFGNSSRADFFEVHNNLSRLASLIVSCIVHYSLSSCLATLAILLCYQSILMVQMVLFASDPFFDFVVFVKFYDG